MSACQLLVNRRQFSLHCTAPHRTAPQAPQARTYIPTYLLTHRNEHFETPAVRTEHLIYTFDFPHPARHIPTFIGLVFLFLFLDSYRRPRPAKQNQRYLPTRTNFPSLQPRPSQPEATQSGIELTFSLHIQDRLAHLSIRRLEHAPIRESHFRFYSVPSRGRIPPAFFHDLPWTLTLV